MPKRLKLELHLTPEALKQHFKQAQEPTALRRWQVLYLVSQGWSTRAIAETTTYHPQTIREIVWRYNTDGPQSVADGRRSRSRRQPPLLSPEQLAELRQALTEADIQGHPWNGGDVTRWMSQRLGRPIQPQRGWDYLQKARSSVDNSDG
ncbi:MAG: helix-turn-helix domain-containing protein [Myxococcota bacterium]